MKFVSTRGGSAIGLETAALLLYHDDGGLLLPEVIPKVTEEDLKSISKLEYQSVVRKILRYFIDVDDIPDEDFDELIESAFSRFDIDEIVKLKLLSNGLCAAELFHGPTWTLKDLSVSLCGKILLYFLRKRNEKALSLVVTSGDTGNAAIEAVAGSDDVDIIVLYPHCGVTEIQKRKMCTVLDSNVHCFGVEGSSDDADAAVKDLLFSNNCKSKSRFVTLNSFNVVRIMTNCSLFFYIYGQMNMNGRELEIVIPSGGFGSIASAMLAEEMGLPIKLVATTTVNDSFVNLLNTGIYDGRNKVLKTISPAMDMQVVGNMERILYIASGRDVNRVNRLMKQFEETKFVEIPQDLIIEIKKRIVDAIAVSDETKKQTIRRCYEDNQYFLCPHTAAAVSYHYKQLDSNSEEKRRVCLATASARRFPEAIIASGLKPPNDEYIEKLLKLPTRYEILKKGEDWCSILKEKIRMICAEDD